MKKMNGKGVLLLLCIFALSPVLTFGQSSNLTWYIGNRIVEFHRTTNEPTPTNNAVNLQGPAAVVTNPANGDILFYTDGQTIYDALNQPMPSNNALDADVSKNQPVVVAQVPGNANQYYVITNSPTGLIEIVTVDMLAQGNTPATVPLGNIVGPPTQVGTLNNQSDGMITIADGDNFYLITHNAGSSTYNITHFTAGGAMSFSSVSAGLIQNIANIAFNPETNQLAIAPADPNQNIEILTFDPGSGTLLFEGDLPLTSSTQSIYDIEWGPIDPANPTIYNLYYSTFNSATSQYDVLQYPISNMTSTDPLIAPVSILPQPNTITASYGLQTGPDGDIYHLYEQGGQIRMGKIDFPDNPTDAITYVPQAVPGVFTETQFPATLPGQDLQVSISFTYDQPCVNVPTQFFPTVSHPVDSLEWTTIDANGTAVLSNDWSPIHTFTTADPVPITVNAYIGGEIVASSTQQITPTAFDVQITLDPEITGCHDEFTDAVIEPPGWVPCTNNCLQVTAQVQGGGTMQWFGPNGPIAGANSATFHPETPGYYWLEVTNGTCTAYAGINVKEYEVEDPKAFNWYFGNQAGIDFNPLVQQPTPGAPIDISSSSAMNAPEGTATISDRNGKIIFYTDGESVWLRDNPTPITTNLGGDNTATQSALIMPVQGDETLFYIFTTQEISTGGYELRYAVFDRKLDPVNGIGALVDPTPSDPADPPSTVLFTKSTERILGVGNWVIVHEYGTNTFRAYEVTTEGISAPVYSNVGSDHAVSAPSTGVGYMMYGAGRIAVALTEPGGNFVEVFDFDDATGEVTNARKIAIPPAFPGQVYGVNFSADGDRMYVTVLGQTNTILEFELDDDADPETYVFLGNINANADIGGQAGAIMRGLGGLMVAVQGGNALGMIDEESQDGVLSNYVANQPPQLAGQVTLGLPNFVQVVSNPPSEPGITPVSACIDQEVTLVATGKDPTIDQFNWYFHDGTVLRDAGPEVPKTYSQAGTFPVRVLIYNKCEPINNPNAQGDPSDPNNPGGVDNKFFTADVVVNPSPAEPIWTAPGENTLICDGNPVTLRGYDPAEYDPNVNPADLTFQWSNGSTADHIDVTQQGTYTVTATNQFGCATTSEKEVFPFFQISLGPDIAVCEDDVLATPLIAGFDSRATYAWTIDGNPVPTQAPPNELAINTSVPKATPYVYRVTLTNAAVNCSVSDEVLVSVNAVPQFNAVGNPFDCNDPAATGSIDLTGVVENNLSYTIRGTSGTIGPLPIAPPGTSVSPLTADTYVVTLSNNLTGCANPKTVTVDNNNFTITAAPLGDCHPNITFDVTGGVGATGPFNYEVRGPDGGLLQAGTANSIPLQTTGTSGTDGDYAITVIEAGTGCRASDVVTITTTPLTIGIDQSNICAATNQISLISNPTATSVSWTVNGAPAGTPNSLTLTLQPGTWNVGVTASGTGPGQCPATLTRSITIAAPIDVSFEQSSACIRPVELTATTTPPATNLEWYVGTQLLGTGNPLQVIQAPAGNVHVTAIASTGCSYSSAPKPVEVVEPFTVNINSLTNPICENTEFTLAAVPSRPITFNDHVWSLNGSQISGNNNDQLTDTRGGSYTVTVRVSGCEATSPPFVVAPQKNPSVDLGPLKRICPREPVNRLATLDPGQYTSYRWFLDVGNGAQLLPETTQTIDADTEGIYIVEVADAIGCTNTDQVEVIEECDPILNGPNAFKPTSSDANNRAFMLFHFFISEDDFEILIFNRWGEMVYESTDPNFRWNGGYKGDSGRILPSGTYAYVVKYKSEYFPEQGIKQKRGGVLLIQ